MPEVATPIAALLMGLSCLGWWELARRIAPDGLEPSWLPILGCCAQIVALFAFSLADLLVAGTWAVIGLGIASAAYSLLREGPKAYARYACPEIALLLLAGATLAILHKGRLLWTAESFMPWAGYLKVMMMSGRLPNALDILQVRGACLPGLPLWQYLWCRAVSQSESMMMISKGWLELAGLAALFTGVYGRKGWTSWALRAGLCILAYFITICWVGPDDIRPQVAMGVLGGCVLAFSHRMRTALLEGDGSAYASMRAYAALALLVAGSILVRAGLVYFAVVAAVLLVLPSFKVGRTAPLALSVIVLPIFILGVWNLHLASAYPEAAFLSPAGIRPSWMDTPPSEHENHIRWIIDCVLAAFDTWGADIILVVILGLGILAIGALFVPRRFREARNAGLLAMAVYFGWMVATGIVCILDIQSFWAYSVEEIVRTRAVAAIAAAMLLADYAVRLGVVGGADEANPILLPCMPAAPLALLLVLAPSILLPGVAEYRWSRDHGMWSSPVRSLILQLHEDGEIEEGRRCFVIYPSSTLPRTILFRAFVYDLGSSKAVFASSRGVDEMGADTIASYESEYDVFIDLSHQSEAFREWKAEYHPELDGEWVVDISQEQALQTA